MNRRAAVDVVAGLAGAALLAFTPFHFCHQTRCTACTTGWAFAPPLFDTGPLLCSVNLEQFALRMLALVVIWAIARKIVAP